jgi:hypothetical protein
MIPYQEDHDPESPEQHVVWALRQLPMIAGIGAITNPAFLRGWSKHLWQAGFRHVDWIRKLADEDGNIHVSKLPEQEIKFQHAFRGPQHGYNNAARWVGKDTPEPKPFVVPNIEQMTHQEKYALLYQLDAAGVRIPQQIKRDTAEVEGSPRGR